MSIMERLTALLVATMLLECVTCCDVEPAPRVKPPSPKKDCPEGHICDRTNSLTWQGAPDVKEINGKQYVEVSSRCGVIPNIYINAKDNTVSKGGNGRASPKEIPWQVRMSIMMKQGDNAEVVVSVPRTCGGVLLDNSTALTAASCLVDAQRTGVTVFLGKNDRKPIDRSVPTEFKVKAYDWILHPQFVKGSSKNDVALLKFPEVSLNDGVLPICLPNQCSEVGTDENGNDKTTTCVASGWASQVDNGEPGRLTLQKAYSKVMTLGNCAAVMARTRQTRFGEAFSRQETGDHFACARNVPQSRIFAVCQADTGGPLACKNSQSGLYQAEGILAFHNQCEDADRSIGAFTRICKHSNWIKSLLSKQTQLNLDPDA